MGDSLGNTDGQEEENQPHPEATSGRDKDTGVLLMPKSETQHQAEPVTPWFPHPVEPGILWPTWGDVAAPGLGAGGEVKVKEWGCLWRTRESLEL